jgi:hypothetical protein
MILGWDREEGFSHRHIVQTGSLVPTRPTVLWVPWVQRPRREASHSPPSNAEIKNAWSCTSTPPYVFMAW